MSDNTIPEYLQPALAQLEKARAAHLENARLMDETVTAIERAEQEKNALTQADGNDADDWRTAFRAASGVLSDELKQRHIERVARRELVKALHCQEHRGVCLRKSLNVFMCARIRAVVWCLKRFRPSTASLSARSRRTNWQKACMKNRNCRQYG